MKKIKYKTIGFTEVYKKETDSVEKKEIFVEFIRDYSQENEEIAKRESYNGEYIVEDDGEEENISDLQRIAELEEALEMLLSGVTE